MPLAKDVDLRKLAKKTEGWAGKELYELCQKAALSALRRSLDSMNLVVERIPEDVLQSIVVIMKDFLKDYSTMQPLNRRTTLRWDAQDQPRRSGHWIHPHLNGLYHHYIWFFCNFPKIASEIIANEVIEVGLGDAHALQGDGEICGYAVEIQSKGKAKVKLKEELQNGVDSYRNF